MAETVIEDKYVSMVPRFELPKDFDKKPEPQAPAAPPAEVKPTEPAPVTEGADPEKAEPLTTAKEPEKPEKEISSRRFERRIDRATKARAEAEARAEALAREVNELKARQTPATDPQAPKMENFSDIEEYAKAKSEYAVKQEFKVLEEKQRKEQAQTAQKALLDKWAEDTGAGEDKYDDFAEVVGELQPTNPWTIAIMKADNSADVAYYLGKHLKEAQKIISLDPVSQIYEIGKLSFKLSQAPVAPKKPSNAPAPITPVTGSADGKTPALTDAMSPEQYMKVGHQFFRGKK